MQLFNKQSIHQYVDLYKKLQSNPFATTSASFVATVLLILILFTLVIRPTAITISTLHQKIEEFQDLNLRLEDKKKTLQQLSSEYNQMQSTVDLVEQALPKSADFLLLEKQIRYLTQKHVLSVSSLAYGGFPLVGNILGSSVPDNPNIIGVAPHELSLSMTVTGEYANIKNFISELERFIRIADLDNYTIQISTVSPGKVDLMVNGNVYYTNFNSK